MKYVLLVFNLFLLLSCSNNNWAKIEFDNAIYDSFYDEQTWNYPWYIIKCDDGSFSSAMGDTITASDTVHLYHTAKCYTNHQGEHEVNYCYAHKNADTLVLSFSPALPAYWLNVEVKIIGDKFVANASGVPFTPISLKWETVKQELTLQNGNYNIDDSIKGQCNFKFAEQIIGDSVKTDFYFSGIIKTVISNIE